MVVRVVKGRFGWIIVCDINICSYEDFVIIPFVWDNR